ncbi:hypothetical protein L6164_009664 [Bauhinia variegata]|uniref:Uncharacterized protein n=1 Tax=Bauhinia variegata TaxID=167791 RepID=A0ACB9PKE2_BAUVA|nr:hypothetical protein L6164_009664 [Bauhinia variegata]
MAQKHLHQLLQEDQEPFLLDKYISDRRTQLKRPNPKTNMQVKKRKSIYQTSHFPANLCKNACFYSFPDTPDLTKSPLFDLASPVKSPCKSPNVIFLHVPARTAALLLQAALRIQKQSTSSKTKTQNKNNGFGLFGSLFKRLTHRKREIEGNGVKVSVKDILRWDSPVVGKKISNGSKRQEPEKMEFHKEKNSSDVSPCEMGFSCSSNGRLSSAVWSESNEDKSLDLEPSTSGHSDDEFQEIDFVCKQKHGIDCVCCDDGFCESPFHFVLQRSPSSGRRTPELPSPTSSPSRRRTEDEKSDGGAEGLKKFQSGEEEEEEEEEKEQCSPVSVLDPPFEDDDDGQENDDGFDLECSYAIVQRTKQQLLYKLRRFEKLAELDPIELEKRMLDQEEDETFMVEDECEDDDTVTFNKGKDFEGLFKESICHERGKIPEDLKRLVSDLIMEEEREAKSLEGRETVMKRVCKRLEMWKGVESNTIDMMIEEDFCREDGQWKKNGGKSSELAGELELAILGFLVEELSDELVGLE